MRIVRFDPFRERTPRTSASDESEVPAVDSRVERGRYAD